MKFAAKFVASLFAVAVLASLASAQSAAPDTFPPFEQWKGAVLAGDAPALKALYSTDPAAQMRIKTMMHDADADTSFWLALKPRSMNVEIVRLIVHPTRANVIFRVDVLSRVSNQQNVNVTDDQTWMKQGDQWRLVYAERTDAPRLAQPADMKKDLYPADVDAHAEI
ncbi:MAG: nuclear transport factor 2 family protein [Candidatus Sulfotelmatobacter sp.]